MLSSTLLHPYFNPSSRPWQPIKRPWQPLKRPWQPPGNPSRGPGNPSRGPGNPLATHQVGPGNPPGNLSSRPWQPPGNPSSRPWQPIKWVLATHQVGPYLSFFFHRHVRTIYNTLLPWPLCQKVMLTVVNLSWEENIIILSI